MAAETQFPLIHQETTNYELPTIHHSPLTIVQNEPNSRTAGVSPAFRSCIARNEPNPRTATILPALPSPNYRKRTQSLPSPPICGLTQLPTTNNELRTKICETNPISVYQVSRRPLFQRNEPNSPHHRRPPGPTNPKLCETNPIFVPRHPPGLAIRELCETNPIPTSPASPSRITQNEPNSHHANLRNEPNLPHHHRPPDPKTRNEPNYRTGTACRAPAARKRTQFPHRPGHIRLVWAINIQDTACILRRPKSVVAFLGGCGYPALSNPWSKPGNLT